MPGLRENGNGESVKDVGPQGKGAGGPHQKASVYPMAATESGYLKWY